MFRERACRWHERIFSQQGAISSALVIEEVKILTQEICMDGCADRQNFQQGTNFLNDLIIPVIEQSSSRDPLDPVMHPAFRGELLFTDVDGELPVLAADEGLHHGGVSAGEFLQGVDVRIIEIFRLPERYLPGQLVDII